MRSLCTALVVSLFLATAAHAEPAVVKVFEAQAYAQPDATSPVLHTFVEKAEVSVSEEAEAGWRRVRLPDGSVGWIQERALRLVTAEAVPAVASPPAAPAATVPAPAMKPVEAQAPAVTLATATDRPTATPAPAPRIYVKDLDHLAELVKEDDLVGPKARQLAERKTTSGAVTLVSIAAGLGVGVLGFTAMSTQECTEPLFPGSQRLCHDRPAFGMVGAGAGIALTGSLLALALAPKANDLLDLVNEWNTRHPANPFELTDKIAPASLR